MEGIVVIALLDDGLRAKHTDDAYTDEDYQGSVNPIHRSNRAPNDLVAEDNAEYSKAEVGRDGTGAVDGLFALVVEPLVHLNAEHRVDNDFEGAEADGADDDTCWHFALHDAIERESGIHERGYQVGVHVGEAAHGIAVKLVGMPEGIVLVVEAAGEHPLLNDVDGHECAHGGDNLQFNAPLLPVAEDDGGHQEGDAQSEIYPRTGTPFVHCRYLLHHLFVITRSPCVPDR